MRVSADEPGLHLAVKECMQRIEGTQVLLLKDHLQDGDKVWQVLNRLEALSIVKVKHRSGQALDFFAEEEETPSAIIMFMNCKEILGVYFDENYRLLSLSKFGIQRLRYRFACTIEEANAKKRCLTEFLSNLVPVQGPFGHFTDQ